MHGKPKHVTIEEQHARTGRKIVHAERDLRAGPAADLLREAAPFVAAAEDEDDNGVDISSANPRLLPSKEQQKHGHRIRVSAEKNIPSGPPQYDDSAAVPAPSAAGGGGDDEDDEGSGSSSSSNQNKTFVKRYASFGNTDSHTNFGSLVRPTQTEWIWNMQGITFASVVTFVEKLLNMRIVGGRAADWAWENLHTEPLLPVPGAGLGLMSEEHAHTWCSPFLKVVSCPSGHGPQCSVRVVIHTPTSTAWMTTRDAAQYLGRSWSTLMTNLPAALVSSRLCQSEEPLWRLDGKPAQGIMEYLRKISDGHLHRSLPRVDSDEDTVLGIPALVCMSTGIANLTKTLTRRMLPRTTSS